MTRNHPASTFAATAALILASCAPVTSRLPADDDPRASDAAAALAPSPPEIGAVVSGSYRNLFREWRPDITEADVEAKLETYWGALFGTDPDRQVYNPAGSNTGLLRLPGYRSIRKPVHHLGRVVVRRTIFRPHWELEPPSGQWRYYDGLLAFTAMLHASGRFRAHRA